MYSQLKVSGQKRRFVQRENVVITAFEEEHVGSHDEEKETMPAAERISSLKTLTAQGKTQQGVMQVVRS